MRLSNKSTFSLVCFILLLAFVALPVMAHAPDSAERAHTHPLNEALPALDGNGDNDTNDPGEAAVAAHNGHPVPMLSIEDDASTVTDGVDGNKVRIVAVEDDTGTNDVDENEVSRTFTVLLDFGQTIVGTATQTAVQTAVTDDDDATTETDPPTVTLTYGETGNVIALNKNGTVIGTGLTVTAARTADNLAQLTLTVEVEPAALPDGMGTATDGTATDVNAAFDEITVRISIPATAASPGVYSLATRPAFAVVNGGASYATDEIFELILVSDLGTDPPPVTPPDTTAPTLAITHSPADRAELPASGNVTFTFTFDEALGANDNAFSLGDVTITNGSAVDFAAGADNTYTVEVTPTDPTQNVTVSVAATAVADAAGNNLAAAVMETYMADDTVAPTVTITSAAGTGDDAGKVVFTFTFSEPLAANSFMSDDLIRGTGVTLAGNPTVDATDNKVYTVLVTPSTTGDTILTLKTGSVEDMQGNALVGDQAHTYVPAEPPVDPPDPPANPTAPANISGVITVPGNSFVMLVRDADVMVGGTPQASLMQRFAGIVDINNDRVIPDANIIEWSGMPDLSELFDRGAPGGGGALVLRKSVGDTAAPAVGTVGISEIMWAMDAGYIGQTQARDTQWIELHNLNAEAKKVLIYAQTGAQFTDANKVIVNSQAGDTLHGNPGGMIVDVMTNYFNGSSRGSAGWDVPGSNGSSKTGIDFVSMARKGTFDLASKHDGKYNKRYVKTGGSENSSDGRSSGSWQASTVRYDRDTTDKPASVTTAVPATFDYLGTPGRANTFSVSTHLTTAGRTNLNDTPNVIFNEIGNRSDADKAYEWIEVRNTTGSNVSLKAYIITTITAVGTENILYRFPHDKAADVPANGVLLLLASDPAEDTDHPIAVGYNIDKPVEDQYDGSKGDHVPRYKVTPFSGNGIPNGNFILVLRRPDNAGKNDISERGKDDLDKIVDIAGKHSNLSKPSYPNAVSSTSFWPLHNFPAPNFGNNDLTENKVHYRRNVRSNKDDRLGTGAWDNDNGKSAYTGVGFSGIGYKRWVPRSGIYGGDPGYHNPKVNLATDVADAVSISEIMLSTGENGRLPQWIEITNNSLTKTINLKSEAGWRLVIETPGDAIRTLNFKDWDNGNFIYPNQTVLIVAGSVGRGAQAGSDLLRSSIVFKSDRVFNVLREYGTKFSEIEEDGEMVTNDRYRFVHAKSFNIKLIDGKNNVADEIGNLDGRARTNDVAKWEYPEGLTKDGYRTSFIRVYDDGVPRAAVGSEAVDVIPRGLDDAGLELNDIESVIPNEYAWIRAEMLNFDSIYVRHTWYGSESDFGTPGSRKGQPLPVSLSSFRPALEDGKVVIRWTTESELDNAGFNIYRSDSRNGEFTQVNEQLIQGKGTTAERSTYKWVDTSAKPGAVYYYQIEDVSFAGERNMLTTTKMKGLISAKDKLTTKWGELKEVQ